MIQSCRKKAAGIAEALYPMDEGAEIAVRIRGMTND